MCIPAVHMGRHGWSSFGNAAAFRCVESALLQMCTTLYTGVDDVLNLRRPGYMALRDLLSTTALLLMHVAACAAMLSSSERAHVKTVP